MSSLLTKNMQGLVLAGEMPAKEVASAIGKPYSTLMRELNPYDEGAKLGAETMLEIMKITGDKRVLEFLAREMGCVVVPDPLVNLGTHGKHFDSVWA